MAIVLEINATLSLAELIKAPEITNFVIWRFLAFFDLFSRARKVKKANISWAMERGPFGLLALKRRNELQDSYSRP